MTTAWFAGGAAARVTRGLAMLLLLGTVLSACSGSPSSVLSSGGAAPRAQGALTFEVGNLAAIPMTDRVVLSWNNPPDSGFAGVLILHRTGRFPASPEDGDVVANVPGVPGTATWYVHSRLVTKVTHYYTVFSYNASGQFSSGVQASARTTFSYLAQKAARPQVLRQEYPYTNPQQLTDGVYGSDSPADAAWVAFSSSNVNPNFFSVDSFSGFDPANWRLTPLAQEMGTQAFRVNLYWSAIEAARGVYNWNNLDRSLGESAKYGLKPYFLIMMPPAWSQPMWWNDPRCPNGGAGSTCRPSMPPDNLQDYADFTVALVNHVNANFPDQTTKVIEVWNEINEDFWKDTEEQYLKMLEATYKAVKPVDPSWRIMAETFSGLELTEFDYLYGFKDEYGASILKQYSDLIAIHPYGGVYGPDEPAGPKTNWSSFSLLADNAQRVKDTKISGTPWGWHLFQLIDENDPSPNVLRSWRQIMVKNGDGAKKVWLTEIGWHRSGFDGSDPGWPYPPDDKRIAELISRLFQKSSEYDFIENVTIYDLWTSTAGLLIGDYTHPYTKTNAYYAFQNLATTDGIVIDLSKSPTNAYPAPQHSIKGIKVGALNYAQDGHWIYRIQKIDVSISSDNITYTSVGQITNMGPDTGRVDLTLDNISQVGRWIKLQITPAQEANKVYLPDVEKASGLQTPQIPPSAVANSYLIDEVDVELGP